MQGNPVAYRNLHRHFTEILSYLEIALDSDFVLEELNSALIEAEKTFGVKNQLPNQIRQELKELYKKYIDRKALPLEKNDEKRLKEKITYWLQKYYRKPLY